MQISKEIHNGVGMNPLTKCIGGWIYDARIPLVCTNVSKLITPWGSCTGQLEHSVDGDAGCAADNRDINLANIHDTLH